MILFNNALVLSNICKYRHKSNNAKKLDSLCHILVAVFADSMSLASTTLTYLPLKANAFSVILQNNGHYAVQGHSMSPILVAIESPHATSY